MSRVAVLQKKYPSIPKQFIVRWDAMVHGLKDTGILDEYFMWVQSSHGGSSYASYDFDTTFKEWVAAKPGRTKDGLILRPSKTWLLPEDGWYIEPRINTKSDLQIIPESGGKFALYQGEERVHDLIYQLPKPDGLPRSERVAWKYKHCFMITAVRSCEYFALGVACKFCNFNATQDDARSVGVNRAVTINVDQTVEDYKQRASQIRVVEGMFEFGGMANNELEEKLHASFIEKIANATTYKPNFLTLTQPLSRKQMQRLKDAGLESIAFDMEMWDPDLFEETVPGKAKYHGRESYLQAYEEAVSVFGVGNVGGVLVGGLGLIPENGHKTWRESRDSMIEAFTWMIKTGVLPVFTSLRLPPGCAYACEENRKKLPPTEYYLELALAHHELMKQYGLYEKMNRLMWCPLCCQTSAYTGELGAYELRGSLANWAADVVPREANWLLDWQEQRVALAR